MIIFNEFGALLKHKKFKGPLQITENVKKDFISSAKLPYQALLNAVTLRQF
jgi:hypothetical protein